MKHWRLEMAGRDIIVAFDVNKSQDLEISEKCKQLRLNFTNFMRYISMRISGGEISFQRDSQCSFDEIKIKKRFKINKWEKECLQQRSKQAGMTVAGFCKFCALNLSIYHKITS